MAINALQLPRTKQTTTGDISKGMTVRKPKKKGETETVVFLLAKKPSLNPGKVQKIEGPDDERKFYGPDGRVFQLHHDNHSRWWWRWEKVEGRRNTAPVLVVALRDENDE